MSDILPNNNIILKNKNTIGLIFGGISLILSIVTDGFGILDRFKQNKEPASQVALIDSTRIKESDTRKSQNHPGKEKALGSDLEVIPRRGKNSNQSKEINESELGFINTNLGKSDISFLIKYSNELDEDLTSRIESYLSSQGTKCNLSLFKPRALEIYSDLRSPNQDFIKENRLGLFCKWCLVGEIKLIEEANLITPDEKVYILLFNGNLIGIDTDNFGKKYPIKHLERETGNKTLAMDKAYENTAKWIANLVYESI